MKPTQLTVIIGLLTTLMVPALPAAAGPDTSLIRIRRVAGDSWLVNRRDVEPFLNEGGRRTFVKEVRLRKHAPNGRQWGYKIRRVAPNSAYTRLGLQAGDVLIQVNGVKLTSDAAALRAFNKARKAKTIKVVLQRRGARRIQYYTVD